MPAAPPAKDVRVTAPAGGALPSTRATSAGASPGGVSGGGALPAAAPPPAAAGRAARAPGSMPATPLCILSACANQTIILYIGACMFCARVSLQAEVRRKWLTLHF